VKGRLCELLLPTERHVVASKFGLEELSKQDPRQMVRHVWDNKYNGNRHVVIDCEPSFKTWYRPMDLGQGKTNEAKQFAAKVRAEMLIQSISMSSFQESEYQICLHKEQKPDKRQVQLTTQEYYFVKQG
jgi:hypothetical protein